MKYIFSITFLFFGIICAQFAQSDDIQILGQVKKEAIWLRWGLTTPLSWKNANQKGVTIERYTITQNQQMLDNIPSSRKILTSTPLKPQPLDKWMPLLENNDFIAVAAQAIYGESFELTTGEGIISKLKTASELEMRHSFALYAADNSIQVAKLSGLFFEDKEIEPHTQYLYKIYVPSAQMSIDTGLLYINTDQIETIPIPQEVHAKFSENSVEISWNARFYSDVFSSYVIERSLDSLHFERISKQNTVIVEDGEGNVPMRGSVYDSLSTSNPEQHYFYRVRGVTYFGEISEPSEIVSGKAVFTIEGFNPSITQVDENNPQQAQIQWSFPEERRYLLKGFRVLNSPNMEGPYNPVHDALLPPTQYQYIHQNPLQTSFYMIEAEGLKGERTLSFHKLVQPLDTIPPVTPQNVQIQADTSGIIRFSWNQGKENDLYGYRIFTANHPKEEFTEITTDVWTDTTYQDTLNLNTLTEKVYYQVIALDNRYNRSYHNPIIEVQRPDVIPPTAPVITNYQAEEKYIQFTWIPSVSTDVQGYRIARKDYAKAPWKTLIELDSTQLPNSKQIYVDSANLVAGKGYWYKVEALDEAQNVSEPALLKTQTLDRGIRPPVNIQTQVDRKKHHIRLVWEEYKGRGVKRYVIYRAEEGKSLKIHSSIDGTKKEYIDQSPPINKTYQYLVQARFADGAESELIKPISVKY